MQRLPSSSGNRDGTYFRMSPAGSSVGRIANELHLSEPDVWRSISNLWRLGCLLLEQRVEVPTLPGASQFSSHLGAVHDKGASPGPRSIGRHGNLRRMREYSSNSIQCQRILGGNEAQAGAVATEHVVLSDGMDVRYRCWNSLERKGSLGLVFLEASEPPHGIGSEKRILIRAWPSLTGAVSQAALWTGP
jgi:hypothetical protein